MSSHAWAVRARQTVQAVGLDPRYLRRMRWLHKAAVVRRDHASLRHNLRYVLVAGQEGGRFGNGHPSLVPYTTYHASDAMIAKMYARPSGAKIRPCTPDIASIGRNTSATTKVA